MSTLGREEETAVLRLSSGSDSAEGGSERSDEAGESAMLYYYGIANGAWIDHSMVLVRVLHEEGAVLKGRAGAGSLRDFSPAALLS